MSRSLARMWSQVCQRSAENLSTTSIGSSSISSQLSFKFSNIYGVTECCVYQLKHDLTNSVFDRDGYTENCWDPRYLGSPLPGMHYLVLSDDDDDSRRERPQGLDVEVRDSVENEKRRDEESQNGTTEKETNTIRATQRRKEDGQREGIDFSTPTNDRIDSRQDIDDKKCVLHSALRGEIRGQSYKRMRVCKVGEKGELFLSGPGLCRYFRSSALTNQAFPLLQKDERNPGVYYVYSDPDCIASSLAQQQQIFGTRGVVERDEEGMFEGNEKMEGPEVADRERRRREKETGQPRTEPYQKMHRFYRTGDIVCVCPGHRLGDCSHRSALNEAQRLYFHGRVDQQVNNGIHI